MTKRIKQIGLVVLAILGLAACNKEEPTQKAISVRAKGYNIGNTEIEVVIDTLFYNKSRVAPNMLLNFAKVFTYPSYKERVRFSIRDVVSGKDLYQQQLDLSKNQYDWFFPFVVLNGTPLSIPSPNADPTTNKMAFYIHYPDNNDAIDVFMENETGETVYIAKNIKPGTWAYADYVAAEGFKDPNKNYTWRFVKAGTTDQWAFNDDAYKSQYSTNALHIPKTGEKGRVQTYFVTPAANQLDIVALFEL